VSRSCFRRVIGLSRCRVRGNIGLCVWHHFQPRMVILRCHMSDLQLEIVATAVILSAGKSLRLGGFWGVITFIFIVPLPGDFPSVLKCGIQSVIIRTFFSNLID
jgi:hypothetical protein